MKAEEDFLRGFMFAEQVLSSLGIELDINRVIARLMSVARGDVALTQTPDEAIGEIERQTGKKLPRNFRESVYRGHSDSGADDTDRRKAEYILESMGYTASDWAKP